MSDYTYKRNKSGNLEKYVQTQGNLGGAIAFTKKYWKGKMKGKGVTDDIMPEKRDTLGKGTRTQLEKLDSF